MDGDFSPYNVDFIKSEYVYNFTSVQELSVEQQDT